MNRKVNASDENNNLVYGYARVSTAKQSLDRQITNLTRYNANIVIYKEKYSGRNIENRAELNKLLKVAKKGDSIVFDSVSRMSRNAEEGFTLYKELYEKGINLVFLNESNINTEVFEDSIKRVSKSFSIDMQIQDKSTNNLVSSIMKAIEIYNLEFIERQIKEVFAQSEKELMDIRSRISQGIRERKAKGLRTGGSQHRVRKDKKEKLDNIYKMSKSFIGNQKDKDLIKLLHISSVTLCKYKRELRESIENGSYKVA